MRTVRNAGITEYLVDLKLCTGNEDTPVVVEDVNADEGAGGSSDEKGNNIHLHPCSCVLLLMGMFWTALTLRLSTGGDHNLTTGNASGIMWLNVKVCCTTACE